MKAAVISLGSKSSLMTIEEMKKYFDEVDNIQLKNIEVQLGKDGCILYEGEPFKSYDCVYVKGSFRYANLLRSIASMLEGKVPYMPLHSSVFSTAHNKLLTHLILEQKGIPMPKTYISSTVDAAKELLKKVNYPIVMKFPEGTQGKGVMFADSPASAASMLDALVALNQPFIIQEYVETGGADIRALVVGDKVVAAMRRQAAADEKRSNLHAGGSGVPVTLSHEATLVAIDTAKTIGADVCGVDILEGPRGPVVIEVNISPGLQGITEATGINIADFIARHFHKETEKIVKTKKKKEAEQVMRELDLNGESSQFQEIITRLTFRGDKIVLPELVNKLAKLSNQKEYAIKIKKNEIQINQA